jgi:hypothetical protein
VSYWTIPRQWEGRTVAVLASGPSLTKEDAEKVRHLPRITTNATYRAAPDADVLYGSDVFFWRAADYADVLTCPGLKVCIEQVPGVRPYAPDGVLIVRHGGTQGFTDDPAKIRTGGNSGYAAIHLAASMGAKRILLLGLDMNGGHWHGPHPHGLNNPRAYTFNRWMRNFRTLAPALKARGIEVVNCSPGSALECFPKAALDTCL